MLIWKGASVVRTIGSAQRGELFRKKLSRQHSKINSQELEKLTSLLRRLVSHKANRVNAFFYSNS